MSGHVFHPGHDALHGITVVLETTGSRTCIGRFDKRDAAGVHLLQVGIHEAGAGISREDYIRRADEFGITVDRPHLVVPETDVARITPLGDMNRP